MLRTVPWFFIKSLFVHFKFPHIDTGNIYPQYHVVFDNLFETVYSTGENDPIVDVICNKLFDRERDWYVLKEYDEESKIVYKPPPLH